MKKAVAVLAVLLCVLLSAGFPHASGTPTMGAGVTETGPIHSIVGMLIKLNLTDVQKHDIAVILKRHLVDARTIAQAVMEGRKNLFELISSDEVNEDAIRAACRQVAASEERLAVLRARVLHEIKATLTPEQQTTMNELRNALPGKIKGRIDARLALVEQWIDIHSK